MTDPKPLKHDYANMVLKDTDPPVPARAVTHKIIVTYYDCSEARYRTVCTFAVGTADASRTLKWIKQKVCEHTSRPYRIDLFDVLTTAQILQFPDLW